MSNPYLPLSPSSSAAPTTPYSSTPGPYATASSSQEPTTRSRTLFYLSVRDSNPFSETSGRNASKRAERQYGQHISLDDGEEEEGLIGGREGHTEVGMKGLPPKWVDISEEVEEILARAKLKIAALDKLHAKHVLPGFTDRSAEEREIERQTDFRRCTSLTGSVRPSQGAPRVQVLTAKNVQRGLAQKVQELSGQFRKKQRVYMQKLQGHAIKNKDLMVASGAITLKGSDVLDELQEDEQAVSACVVPGPWLIRIQSQSQLQSQSKSQAAISIDIDQRSSEISQIASSISELAELFRDLGNMVVEQGTILDSVEYNVLQANQQITEGLGELKVAQKYQARTGRRKCIFFLILCIFALILILIYKPHSDSSSTPSPTASASGSEGMIFPSPSSGTVDAGDGFTEGEGDDEMEGIVLPSGVERVSRGAASPTLARRSRARAKRRIEQLD
ncbi:hypothetical protein L202_03313 [Cryptococcus amylolentus CBS 6039]|uniref:t-SNARE coiled-coil homology domain-containing protein n=1 Tax=Cryptococcus amylolentus CBS 6039 TaxID=1295533 RepID=A0A1E3HUW7_9TREE|nr:hypothetical protein L202_03313 [Cryptococcus amylolentus CBS 6039]ODN79301.1 hypothetical protein L202_03313 [Cryptococcus amylolentus CBS 6039]